jgi:hypothetical protein
MRFHGFVRGVLGRLAAALLIALVARPDVVPCPVLVAAERATASAPEDGMATPPTHAASAYLAIAPAGVVAPPAPAAQRVLVSLHPALCQIIANSVFRLPTGLKPAPMVLRV